MTENSISNDSRQAKAWGSDFSSWRIIILTVFGSQVFFLENFLLQQKEDSFITKYQLGNPTLGALSYLHVGFQLGGIQIRTRNGSGHGWEERGSPQVIWSSNKGQICIALLMLVI